jgi:hypothetical protein
LALGHNSKAVHRAYAKAAQVTLSPLEDYQRKIVPIGQAAAYKISRCIQLGGFTLSSRPNSRDPQIARISGSSVIASEYLFVTKGMASLIKNLA